MTHNIDKTLIQFLLLMTAALALSACNALDPVNGAPPGQIRTSGVIQADEVSIASEFGGLIAEIPAVETEEVAAGQVVVRLDCAVFDAQIEGAEALVDMAEARLAQARTGARPGQIAVAEAQLTQAEAGRIAAQQAVSDTLAMVENPQEIDLEIAVTRGQLEAAEHELAQAVTFKDAVEIVKAPADEAWESFHGKGPERFKVTEGTPEELLGDAVPQIPDEVFEALPDDLPSLPDGDYTHGDWELHISDGVLSLYRWVDVQLPLDISLLPNTWWQSWVGVNAAGASKDGLEATLADLYARRANPQELVARAHEAQAALAEIEAQVALAEIQVAAMKEGATPEQLAVLEAQVDQARSGRDALIRQREMLSLTTPISGTVMELLLRPGEVAASGAPILTVARLDRLTLTVYVPQTQLGQISVGQAVAITVNSFPGRTFTGRVIRIADEAEFTPRNVTTEEERVNLVFAVEIRVDDPTRALKPGMPADVAFEVGGNNAQ